MRRSKGKTRYEPQSQRGCFGHGPSFIVCYLCSMLHVHLIKAMAMHVLLRSTMFSKDRGPALKPARSIHRCTWRQDRRKMMRWAELREVLSSRDPEMPSDATNGATLALLGTRSYERVPLHVTSCLPFSILFPFLSTR